MTSIIGKLEVLFSPAEFVELQHRDLSATTCVVFDVLRATSSMVTALAHGAESIRPVEEIDEALRVRAEDAGVLLAGERLGLRIDPTLTGSVPFDLGNSPPEFASDMIRGRRIVMTTTNGTRALRACAHARQVLVSSFLNIRCTADRLLVDNPGELLVICSGTFEQAAYEDALAAGALCEMVWGQVAEPYVADSALMVRKLFLEANADLLGAFRQARNGKRLSARVELKEDVTFCARVDAFPILAALQADGLVKRWS